MEEEENLESFVLQKEIGRSSEELRKVWSACLRESIHKSMEDFPVFNRKILES